MKTFDTHDDRLRPASNGVDVRALAKLARLDVSDKELQTLEKEVHAILRFVETIQKVATKAESSTAVLRNVIRDDDDEHESGIHTDALLGAAPARVENRIAVKQVIKKQGIGDRG